MAINEILVVFDPTTETQPAFERALDSARDTGAALHLYGCIDQTSDYVDEDDMRHQLQPRLEELTARAAEAGQRATNELEWAPDWAARAVSPI